MIQGETGTGKGVLARWLHANSRRTSEAFVDLNCGGLSRELLDTELFGHEKGAFTGAVKSKPGLLEIADKGRLENQALVASRPWISRPRIFPGK